MAVAELPGDYAVVVNANICHDNFNLLEFKYYPSQITDGNGIVVDYLRGNAEFRGRILLTNNLVYDNGGRGLHAFESDRVDMVNNTSC